MYMRHVERDHSKKWKLCVTISKILNIKEAINEFLADLTISSYCHFSQTRGGGGVVKRPLCLKKHSSKSRMQKSPWTSSDDNAKIPSAKRKTPKASCPCVQSTAHSRVLKYKSQSRPPLLLIDICYLHI